MSLKSIFLTYVEMQRAANDERSNSSNPAFDPAVRKAYDKANKQKRKVLDEIEKLKNENSDSE